jgi:glycyl-tRNA synthetase beta chain
VQAFIYDRLRPLRERGFAQNEVEAVVAQQPDVLDDVRAPGSRAGLRRLPRPALAAANKRITNILKKIEGVAIDAHGAVQESLLRKPPSKACSRPCDHPSAGRGRLAKATSPALKALAQLRRTSTPSSTT